MSNQKVKDHYYIPCNGDKIEVSEEIYRAWAYYHNKEITSMRTFFNRRKRNKDGTITYLPSKCVYLEVNELSGILHNTQDDPANKYIHNEIRRLLNEALLQLDDDRRHVIVMLFYHRMPEAKIAKLLVLILPTSSCFHMRINL